MRTGTLVDDLIFDAPGRVTSRTDPVDDLLATNPAVDSLFLFTGRPFDQDSQLQNNLNRWYDARVGRWLSEDPLGFAGGDGNLYRYLGNGPVRQMDPDGLFPIVCTCEAMDMIGGYFFSFDVEADWTNGDVYSTCGSACHIDPHRLGRPIIITFNGKWRYKHSPRRSVDIERICAELGQSSACTKSGCTQDCCKATLSKLLQLARTFTVPRGRDECFRWVSYFPIGELATGSANCFSLTDVRFAYPVGVPFTGWVLHHCAKRVTLCDGSWFYIDNGWWGGSTGTFFEEDIPWYTWLDLVF